VKALALDAVGGLEHRAAGGAASSARRARRCAGQDPRAALNRLDLCVADGLPGVRYSFPHIVGSDGAGIVEAVGRDVTAVGVGDRVDQSRHLLRQLLGVPGRRVAVLDLRVVGEHRRARRRSSWSCLPSTWRPCQPGCRGRRRRRSRSRPSRRGACSSAGGAPAGRDGARLGHRQGRRDGRAPGRGTSERPRDQRIGRSSQSPGGTAPTRW
jgi:hypothetical protein